MKSRHHLILALLLLMLCPHCRSVKGGSDGGLPDTVIPTLVIKDAPITQAVQAALAAARRADPRAGAVSVIVQEAPGSAARISVDLKNIPLMEALHLMAASCHYRLSLQNRTVELHPQRPGTPERETAYITLQPHTLRHLHISTLTEATARRALQSLKIDLKKIDSIVPVPGSSALLIQGADADEVRKAAAILDLMNRGLRIGP